MTKSKGVVVEFDNDLLGDNITGLNPPIGYRTAWETEFAQGKPSDANNSLYGASSAAFDGNIGTPWGTSSHPSWISVDLTVAKKTAGLRVYLGSTYRPNEFQLQGSNDNVGWTTIFEGAFQNTTGWQEFSYSMAEYRYFKMNIVTRYSSRTYIYLIQIYEAAPTGNEVAFEVTANEYEHILGDLIKTNYEVTLVEPWQDTKHVLLKINPFTRLRKPDGNITVKYTRELGNFYGGGGNVEDFEMLFTPSDLLIIPNPWHREFISTALENYLLNFIKVTYRDGFAIQNVSVSLSGFAINLINIQDIDP